MTGSVMVFASMIAVPVSAFLCPVNWLLFFAVYPAAALGEMRFSFFRNLLFVAIPPSAALLWAVLWNHPEPASRSFRWICAASAGVYFAGVLGPSGIASILKAAGARRLSETMSLAGSAASSAGILWKRNSNLPFLHRLTVTLKESVSNDPPVMEPIPPAGRLPVTVAAVSWLFLLAAVSGSAA